MRSSENRDFCSQAKKATLEKEEDIQHVLSSGEAGLTPAGGKKTVFTGAPMALLAPLRHKIESRLYRFGFYSAGVRHLLCTQALICGATLVAGLVLLPLTIWPLTLAAGASIAAYSLWGIARFAQINISQQFSALVGLKLFLSFTGRFLLIGSALFALLVLFKVPPIPLVIGLGSAVTGIAAWGISRFTRKTAKEA